MITLVGLIIKHGILIVEFTNPWLSQPVEMIDALVKASSQRLRPILMTIGAMVLEAVPFALADSAGAESRQISWVIVGGTSLVTLLTIFVVPTTYTLLARKGIPRASKKVAKEHPDSHAVVLEYVAKSGVCPTACNTPLGARTWGRHGRAAVTRLLTRSALNFESPIHFQGDCYAEICY